MTTAKAPSTAQWPERMASGAALAPEELYWMSLGGEDFVLSVVPEEGTRMVALDDTNVIIVTETP